MRYCPYPATALGEVVNLLPHSPLNEKLYHFIITIINISKEYREVKNTLYYILGAEYHLTATANDKIIYKQHKMRLGYVTSQ